MEVTRQRRPNEAGAFLAELERVGGAQAPCLREVQEAADLLDHEGFEHAGVGARPSWRELRGCPPSTEGGSRGDRARRMDSWLAVLCELHKRNPLSGAPSDAEHVQSVACDAPLAIGAPSGSVAHCSAYFPGHQTPPGALPDLPSTTIAPSIDAFQPKM